MATLTDSRRTHDASLTLFDKRISSVSCSIWRPQQFVPKFFGSSLKAEGAILHTVGCFLFHLSHGTSDFHLSHSDVTASCFVKLKYLQCTCLLHKVRPQWTLIDPVLLLSVENDLRRKVFKMDPREFHTPPTTSPGLDFRC